MKLIIMKFSNWFVLLLIPIFVSCKKLGCTDENAVNFEKEAQKNDQSCTYEGSVGIWFDSLKYAEYANNGVQTLTYYVNGKEKGLVPIWPYADPAGLTCFSPGVFRINFDLGKAARQSMTLLVKRETGAVIDDYTINVEGGKCELFLMK
jgi:hypothetical protein